MMWCAPPNTAAVLRTGVPTQSSLHDETALTFSAYLYARKVSQPRHHQETQLV